MSKTDYWLFRGAICIIAIVGIMVYIAVFMTAPFALADIDYNEIQSQVAESNATVVQVFCFIGICVLTAIILLSGRISRIGLKFLDRDKSN